MAPIFVNSVEVLQRPTTRPPWANPKEPSQVELPAGSKKTPKARSVPCDILLERDQIVTLRDGVRIRVDIYRPKIDQKVPAILIWSPYGKSGTGTLNLDTVPFRAGISLDRLSGYESSEGLDPAEWVSRGYAVVNADARGVGDSEGDVRFWGTPEGRDGHDTIEEIAKLPWCSAKVAMAGNSWLALSQWFIAAERPPHLACIAPFEGASDLLRETLCPGGIPDTSFQTMIQGGISGRSMQEDTVAMLEKYPNRREYWDDKRARFDRIEVPAFIVASYSSKLHAIGTLRGFEEIPHKKKWLAIHATQEWHDLYSKVRTDQLQKFFDRYLKGIENHWEETPPVTLSVLRFNKPSITNLPFDHLPWLDPSGWSTKQQRLYLGSDKRLWKANDSNDKTLSYKDTEELEFTYQFQHQTTLIGPSKLAVTTSCQTATDFDIHVQLRKRDQNGNDLVYLNIPLEDLPVSDPQEVPNINLLKYLGPPSQLRASRRKVAPELSQLCWPTLAQDKDEPVALGEVLKLEIWIRPTCIRFDPGEQLLVKISGHDMSFPDFDTSHAKQSKDKASESNTNAPNLHTMHAEQKKVEPQTLYYGGSHESYLDVSFLN